MVVLDLKDKKILFELDINAKQSLSKIGKKVGLSKEVVNYRINRLIAEGVIKGFYARIDASKLGFSVFRTFLKFQDLTPKKEKELIDFIVSQKSIGWCVSIQGKWDLNFIFWAKNNNHFFKFWKELKNKYGNHFANNWISTYGWFMNLPKGFLLGKKPENFKPFKSGTHEKENIDEIDFKILSIISEKARTPLIEIAKQINHSDKVVAYHLKQLEQKKIIGGYGVQLDLAQIGYEYWKIHFSLKNYSEKRFNELNNFCIQNPNVVYTNELIGGADFEVDLFVKNYSELQKFIDESRIKFEDLIKNSEIMLYYKEYKLVLFPCEN